MTRMNQYVLSLVEGILVVVNNIPFGFIEKCRNVREYKNPVMSCHLHWLKTVEGFNLKPINSETSTTFQHEIIDSVLFGCHNLCCDDRERFSSKFPKFDWNRYYNFNLIFRSFIFSGDDSKLDKPYMIKYCQRYAISMNQINLNFFSDFTRYFHLDS